MLLKIIADKKILEIFLLLLENDEGKFFQYQDNCFLRSTSLLYVYDRTDKYIILCNKLTAKLGNYWNGLLNCDSGKSK